MKRFKGLSLTFILALALAVVPAKLSAAEFSFRVMPSYDFAIKSSFKNVLGGTVSFDLSPLTVRGRDEIYFSVQASPIFLMAPNVKTVNFFDFGGAAGYNFRINDRFAVAAELHLGGWSFPKNTEMNLEAASGISFGARLLGNYYISPILKAGIFAGYKNYYYKPEPFLHSVELGIGLSINLTKSLFGSSGVKTENFETAPLFPVFYAHYDNNSFGTISFTNIEKNDITDIEISVYIEQFMSVPKVVANYDRIKPGEEFSADLTAFLNESIMNQMQNQLTDALVTVEYKSLGQKSSFESRFFMQTLTRNSMSWEDDRRAAAFVSAKDGAIQRFSRQITLALKDKIASTSSVNYLYARAVFEVFKSYGINYVIDPTSVFSTSDTVAVDFLQFPYQTLLYHGGDCDDLSILNCSLMESLGVATAFITIPGHIYMAYDSGLTAAEADRVYGKGKYIEQDGKVWIPVEITVPQDNFDLALKLGMRQWNKYADDHKLIPIHEAWEEFKPVTVPESDISVQFPKNALKSIK
jgi:transglutaminase-like putative cysteine protease